MTGGNAKKCFVISPIGEEKSPERETADKVLKHLIRKALGDQYQVGRADDDKNPGSITPRMVTSVLEADLIVADLSGLNPNVFYELAIAHGYAKPTVHIQRKGERPPFDVKDMRIVRYDISDPDELEAAQKLLKDYVAFAMAKPDELETPLTAARRFEAVRASDDPVAESNVQMMDAINSLAQDVRRALTPRRRSQSSEDRANKLSVIRMVDRIVMEGRAEASDFEGLVTRNTSTDFDEWLTGHFEGVTGISDEYEQNKTLYDDEMRAQYLRDESPDEDPDI